jgi:hypothetical protein
MFLGVAYMKGIYTGIKHHPWRALVYWFGSFSAQFTIVRAVSHFFPDLIIVGIKPLIVMVVVGLIYGALMIRRPMSVELRLFYTNTKLEIKFGDIFKESGCRVIAVSEFFDSELGQPVSRNSLHGILLSKYFGGHNQAFDDIVKKGLKDSPCEHVSDKQGKTIKYPIGTTVEVPVNNDRYLCFALCRTDVKTLKVYSDVPTLWEALNGLWQKARTTHGGGALVLPLVGSGLSGIGLPPRQLLDLIILSAIAETKKREIASQIKIVLLMDLFNEVDLREVKRHWG